MSSPSAAAAASIAALPTASASPSEPRPRTLAQVETNTAARRRSVLLLEHATANQANDRRVQKPLLLPAGPGSSHHRRKKSSSSKPKWVTVLSIATKNIVLLAVLVYLGRLAWDWAYPVPVTSPSASPIDLELDSRLAAVESSLSSSLRTLQEQLDVIDKKIVSEVSGTRYELTKLLEDKRSTLSEEIKKIEAKTSDLDSILKEFRMTEFTKREELQKFWNEVKESGSLGQGESQVDLDQIRALAKEIVMREIERHEADGIGRVDYALASGGGKVTKHSEAYGGGKGAAWLYSATGRSRNGVHGNANKMLEPSFGEPGQCFALKGNVGFVEIKLRTAIVPEAITLYHVAKSVSYNQTSAPKDCRVSGWFEVTDEDPSNMHVLTEFSYDLDQNSIQTFDIKEREAGLVNMIRFDFTSNHGNTEFTCIYRLRVHGHEPESPISSISEA